ncbi:hypothetical protein PIIN_08353 [Serendipita indica DSM 11827]|uniref:Uncharacterized protein n=1 Tax=Serendipita indica (strain DSM 11827) TaxID=1109443 RepID=G4TSV8_SERID|nr:hypothetical protein PIIN_08353 [Serendipita indica DSM 11827]
MAHHLDPGIDLATTCSQGYRRTELADEVAPLGTAEARGFS